MKENIVNNKSGANDHGFTVQKQVFMYLALVHKGTYDSITYEKSDDVYVAREKTNSLAVEVTIEEKATITTKNKKFRKSLRNFLQQYKNSNYESVSFVFMTTNQSAKKKEKKFTKDFLENVLIDTASGEEKKITEDLKKLIGNLSSKDKENICKNFSVKIFTKEKLREDLQNELLKISANFKEDDRWYDILQRIFKKYSIYQEKYLEIHDIESKIYEVVESDDLRRIELNKHEIQPPRQVNFLEKLYDITADEEIHNGAILDFVSYKNAMEIPNVMELYHYKSEINEELERMHETKYNMTAPSLEVEYLKYKMSVKDIVTNSNEYKHLHLLDRVLEGNVEYLSEINKIFWRNDE